MATNALARRANRPDREPDWTATTREGHHTKRDRRCVGGATLQPFAARGKQARTWDFGEEES